MLVPPEPRTRPEHVRAVRERPVPSTRPAERAVVGVVHHPGPNSHQTHSRHRRERQRQPQTASEEHQPHVARRSRHQDPSRLAPQPPPRPPQFLCTRLACGDVGHADRLRCVGEPRQLVRAALADPELPVGTPRFDRRTTTPAALGRTHLSALRPDVDRTSALAHRRVGNPRTARSNIPRPSTGHSSRRSANRRRLRPDDERLAVPDRGDLCDLTVNPLGPDRWSSPGSRICSRLADTRALLTALAPWTRPRRIPTMLDVLAAEALAPAVFIGWRVLRPAVRHHMIGAAKARPRVAGADPVERLHPAESDRRRPSAESWFAGRRWPVALDPERRHQHGRRHGPAASV